MLPDILAPRTGVLALQEASLNTCRPTTAETNPNFSSGSPAGTLYWSGLQAQAHLGPCGITSQWDLLSQTCSTGAFHALWELRTLSTTEGQRWQSQSSGSQGLRRPRLLMSGCVKRQVISDAPEVQNQLIHRLCDLSKVRLLGPGQGLSESSL